MANHRTPHPSPVPSHSSNFSKMQMPLPSMQKRPRSQGCLPSGPTTAARIGLHWTPAWLQAWGSEPAGVCYCFSSPGALAPLAGSGACGAWVGSGHTGCGSVESGGPLCLGSKALPVLRFGDALSSYCPYS